MDCTIGDVLDKKCNQITLVSYTLRLYIKLILMYINKVGKKIRLMQIFIYVIHNRNFQSKIDFVKNLSNKKLFMEVKTCFSYESIKVDSFT